MRETLGIFLLVAGSLLLGLFGVFLEEEWLNSIIYLMVVSFIPVVMYFWIIRPMDRDFSFNLFISAYILKIIGSISRYWTVIYLYQGGGDAVKYNQDGIYVANVFDNIGLTFDILQGPEGTRGLTYITGIIYSILPPSLLGTFFLFSGLAFAGCVFFYKAYVTSYPEGSRGLYRFMIFFMPSILFWPSSLGKDAWVMFGSGMAAYGVVVLIRTTNLRGIIWAVSGIALIAIVRPHIAAFMLLSAGIAYFMFPRFDSIGRLTVWLAQGLMIILVSAVVFSWSREFLFGSGLEELSWQGIQDFYRYRREVSFGGGSGYLSKTVFTLLGPLYAIITVLFRPLIWEAHNSQAMVSALEATLWLGIIIARRKVLWQRLKSIRKDPVVTFIAVYVVIMILALTTASNLGIVARQRVQFLPFLWMLL